MPLSKYSLGSAEFSILCARLDISGESDLKEPGTEARHWGEAKGYLVFVQTVGCKPIASRARSFQPDRPNEEQLADPAVAKTVLDLGVVS